MPESTVSADQKAYVPESIAMMQDALAQQPDLVTEMADRKALQEKQKETMQAEIAKMPEYAQEDLAVSKEYLKTHPDATQGEIYHFISAGKYVQKYEAEHIKTETEAGAAEDLKLYKEGRNGKQEITGWIKAEAAQVAELKAGFFHKITDQYGQLRGESSRYQNLDMTGSEHPSYWLQVDVKRDSHDEEPGRIYVAPQLGAEKEYVTPLFKNILSMMNQHPDLFQSAKMHNYATVNSLLESVSKKRGEDFLEEKDRIVVYFDKAKRDAVVPLMQRFYKDTYEPLVYEYDTPLFTEPLQQLSTDGNDSIHSTYGMSMADEPKQITGEPRRSRGEILATALFRAKEDVGQEGIETPQFDQAFKGHLEYFGIDPQHPARNIGEGQEDIVEEQLVEEIEEEAIDQRREKYRKDMRPHWIFRKKVA